MEKRRALLSVSDKQGLDDLGARLVRLGWAILASGGTGRALASRDVPYTPVESVTGNPEAFDGRMKTISFQLEGGILFDRDNPTHCEQARRIGIVPIDMVVCNFYPFEQATSTPGCTLTDAVEQIDVGGPTMVRAAAKNFAHVIVLTDPAQYEEVLTQLERGDVTLATRRKLALRAFLMLAENASKVASYLGDNVEAPLLRLCEATVLRYGENPQQTGRYYPLEGNDDPLALHRFHQHQGKEISYNNLLDADAALYALSLLGDVRPAAVIVKHTNPCGAAFGPDIADAFARACEGDPLAAFGGITAVNRPIDRMTAELGIERFFEVLLAPSVDEEARDLLDARKNLRVLTNPALLHPSLPHGPEVRSVRGGLLVQDCDRHDLDFKSLRVVTEKEPTESQRDDLWMAWQICRASRSNAVTLVRDHVLVGNGVGQQDRVGACRIAVDKAGARAHGAAAASDAFFPFPDGPELLAQAGVAAIVHPGGSIRDRDTIDRMNQLGVAMLVTDGIRCFRH